MHTRLMSKKKSTRKSVRKSRRSSRSRKPLVVVKTVRKHSPVKKGHSTKTKSPIRKQLRPLARHHQNLTIEGKDGKMYTSVKGKKSKVWKWVRASKDYHASFRC